MAEPKPVVLLVDDEPRILNALQRSLRREGYRLEAADGVGPALSLLTSRPVDLVLTDYKMPGRSGAELLGRVRRDWPATRRVLLSGWSMEIPEPELRDAAPDAVLPKPWDDPELKATLRRLLVRPT